jgi:hypothetical protein
LHGDIVLAVAELAALDAPVLLALLLPTMSQTNMKKNVTPRHISVSSGESKFAVNGSRAATAGKRKFSGTDIPNKGGEFLRLLSLLSSNIISRTVNRLSNLFSIVFMSFATSPNTLS